MSPTVTPSAPPGSGLTGHIVRPHHQGAAVATPRKMAPPGRYVGRPGYGDPAAERRAAVVRWTLSVGMALVLAFLVYGAVQRNTNPYSVQVVRVVYGSDRVTISWTVSKPTGPAVCVVRSRSQDGREIGRAEVPVAAPVGAEDVQTYTLTTSGTPVSGEVVGCGAA